MAKKGMTAVSLKKKAPVKKKVSAAQKKAAAKRVVLRVTIEFTEGEIDVLFERACFSRGEPLTYAEIAKNPRAIKMLKEDFDPGQIKEEFLDGSDDAIANDWLCEFGNGGSVYEMYRDEEEGDE